VKDLCVLVNTHSVGLATSQIIKLFRYFPRPYSILSVCVQIPRCSAHISAQSLLAELSDTVTCSYCFYSSAIAVTGLRAGRFGVRFSIERRSFTLLQTPPPLPPDIFWASHLLLTVSRKFFLVCKAVEKWNYFSPYSAEFNLLSAKLNPICHLLALLGAHHILHVSRIRVKNEWSCAFSPQCTSVVRTGLTLHIPLSANVT